MSRRHSAQKREVNPDPKFGDIVVTKFMNAVMRDGKVVEELTADQLARREVTQDYTRRLLAASEGFVRA